MKAGDKVWFWSACAYRNVGLIESGRILEVSDDEPVVKVVMPGRERPYYLFKDELFPTRAALCEHYRKVFE